MIGEQTPWTGVGAALAAAPPATLVIALVLGVAVVAALLSKYVRFLPMVTAYILAGILIGPYALKLIGTPEQVARLEPLRDIALAVVLFTIGTRFELDVFRKMRGWLVRWGAWDLLAVLAVVAGPMFLLTGDAETALLMGIIALEIAPAATFLVLRETASSGPMTRLILQSVVVNNIAVVALFCLCYPLFGVVWHGQPLYMLLHGPAVICGSLALGTALGTVISVAEQKYASDAERLLLLLGGILLALGLSQLLGFRPFLITALTVGIVLGNSSAKTELVRGIIERIDAPFYVIFFVLAGASLHLDYLLALETALLATAYITLRTLGRVIGCRLGACGRAVEPRVARWFPLSVLSHSAIAIALVGILAGDHQSDPRFMRLQTIVLAAVAVYELGAPVLLKLALTVTGEVSVAHTLMRGRGLADVGAFKQVFHRLASALGLHQPSQPVGLARAGLEQLIVKDVPAIPSDRGYPKVLGFVSHSRYDCFPVVDADGYYLGYISYFNIQDFAYDQALGDLIIAGDMMATGNEIYLDRDSPQRMAEKFSRANTTYLAVVRPAEKDPARLVLVGLLHQRALMRFMLARSAAEETRREEKSPDSPDKPEGEKATQSQGEPGGGDGPAT